MELNISISFVSPEQREFYYATARNQCFSGGFNDGKTYGACLKVATLLATFPGYRELIARQVRADLMKTTYQTFHKIVPRDLIKRSNEQDGITELVNGSRVIWTHLDNVDESTLRGMEINGVLVDQAEEEEEKVYDVLDSRIGRWDGVTVPQWLLDKYPNWPYNPVTKKPIVPSYHKLLCNPDTQFHWIFRKYHPDSPDRDKNFFFIEAEWNPMLGSREAYDQALKHDEEWVDKYVRGKWGVSQAQIHRVSSDSFLDYNPDILAYIRAKGNLFRSLDHGDTSPTACLWWAAVDGIYICYREYYVPNKLVSDHRQAINDLSEGEKYTCSYADPSIFHKASKKDAGMWSIADEYNSQGYPGKGITFVPADNNEFATRNRINELLRSKHFKHPYTKQDGPGIYFLRKSEDYPYGCYHSIKELQSQRKKLIGYFDGKAMYSDDREETVTDHAYDCIRYFIAMRGKGLAVEPRKVPRYSIQYYRNILARKSDVVAMSS
jgi:hypothetical protein